MSDKIAIEVKNLCVDYRDLGAYSIKRMFLRGKKRRVEDFHAVKNVSFTVNKGEILGIIGKNGCGKSTMLRTIAGIMAPNGGTIDLHGNTVSLLSIGVGFNKNISGRENIILSGMLLGFSREYMLERMDSIIEFSELGKFIDKPVRTYSSGMYSKLAFSVTVNLDAQIILVDEVLSVGDEHFREKSLAKMKAMIMEEDRTVIIVSHSIKTLRDLCTRVMWMHDGEIVKVGEPLPTLREYKKFMRSM